MEEKKDATKVPGKLKLKLKTIGIHNKRSNTNRYWAQILEIKAADKACHAKKQAGQ
jgi:hypothetical protein